MQRIAIIGGGPAGMGAARKLLESGFDVTLFDVNERLGDDCFSVGVPLPGGGTFCIDGGLSDFNRSTFRQLDAFLDDLGLDRTPIVQDASHMTPEGVAIFLARRKEVRFRRPAFRRDAWLHELNRFRREAGEVLEDSRFIGWKTRDYLDVRAYSEEFRRLYLYPRAAECFSSEAERDDAPIRALVAFWYMQGLVGPGPAPKMRVVGGMYRYCDRFARWFQNNGGHLLCSHRVIGLNRDADCVRLRAFGPDGQLASFEADEVILATAPDQAVDLIDDATAAERILARDFRAHESRVVIHRDENLMPRSRESWGAFNYVVETLGESGALPSSMTLYPNLLANLPDEVPDVFVTINPHVEPDPEKVLHDRMTRHPAADHDAVDANRLVEQIQGRRRTWFCGSYLSAPFLHEQALSSGVEVADRLNRALASVARWASGPEMAFA